MKLNFLIIFLVLLSITSCGNEEQSQKDGPVDKPVPICENSFVYNDKVYKVINNELLQIGDLNDTSIRILKTSKSQVQYLGNVSLEFVKSGAEANISCIYRGNDLYFRLELTGINDLKRNFNSGKFIIEFKDALGFVINSFEISTSQLVGDMLNGEIVSYSYDGKIELNKDAEEAISKYDISSTVAKSK